MGNETLACLRVKGDGIAAGTFSIGLTPPPTPSGTVPLPPPLVAVPVKLDEKIDLVDLAILSVVTL